MALAEFAVKKKVAVVMATSALILLGVISVFILPQEYFPKIQFPQITIVTDYSNAAPEEIETLITRPIEETIGSVSGVKRIESVSRTAAAGTILRTYERHNEPALTLPQGRYDINHTGRKIFARRIRNFHFQSLIWIEWG